MCKIEACVDRLYRLSRRFGLGLGDGVSSFTIYAALRIVERLDLYVPDMQSLQHLGGLDILRVLTLPKLPPNFVPPLKQPLFVNLERIWFVQVDMDSAAGFISMRTDSSFQFIRFPLDTFPTARGMIDFVVAVKNCHRCSSSLGLLWIELWNSVDE